MIAISGGTIPAPQQSGQRCCVTHGVATDWQFQLQVQLQAVAWQVRQVAQVAPPTVFQQPPPKQVWQVAPALQVMQVAWPQVLQVA